MTTHAASIASQACTLSRDPRYPSRNICRPSGQSAIKKKCTHENATVCSIITANESERGGAKWIERERERQREWEAAGRQTKGKRSARNIKGETAARRRPERTREEYSPGIALRVHTTGEGSIAASERARYFGAEGICDYAGRRFVSRRRSDATLTNENRNA